MPRLWATTSIMGGFRLGGLFTGTIKVGMFFASLFGLVMMLYVFILLFPLWLILVFVLLIGIGIAVGIENIIAMHRLEDTEETVAGK